MDYTQHAISCGIDMTNKLAIAVDDLLCGWLAEPILHPETQEVQWPIGYWVNSEDIPAMQAMGLDYVIIEEDVL